MEEKQIEKKQEKIIVKKRVYMPPALTVYGKLAELTASGTGQNGENTNFPKRAKN